MRALSLALAAGAVLLAAACQQSGAGGTASASPGAEKSPASLAQRATKSAQPTSQPVRNAPQKTPQPTPRPLSPSLSATYATALQIDAQHLVAANGARISSCSGKDLGGCRTALQQVGSTANALQKDLDAHPAPACMKTADATLRSAIALYLQGVQVGTAGIDGGSATQLAQGKSLLDQGTARLMSASTQLGQSACSAPPPNVAP